MENTFGFVPRLVARQLLTERSPPAGNKVVDTIVGN
jgi:hypothetical protein